MNRACRSREGESGASPLLRHSRCRGASGAAFAASADPEALALPRDTGVGSFLRPCLAARSPCAPIARFPLRQDISIAPAQAAQGSVATFLKNLTTLSHT